MKLQSENEILVQKLKKLEGLAEAPQKILSL